MTKTKMEGMSGVQLVSLICVAFFIIIVIACLWVGVKQERARMREIVAQRLSQAPAGTELRVAEEVNGGAVGDMHIVRIKPKLNVIVADLGKVVDVTDKSDEK